MDRNRQRKLEARARRQESLRNRDTTVEKTANFPEPKNLISNAGIIVGKSSNMLGKGELKEKVIPLPKIVKSPKETVITKRGRGRPPKVKAEQISTKKLATMSVQKSTKKSKEKRK
jgi:hypothetical protein